MLDQNKLKGKIVSCGMNISELSRTIGMNPSSFYRKLNNDMFLVKEALLIGKILKLSKDDIFKIFFDKNVA